MENILKKLQKAKKMIAETDMKKAGRNDYSGYDYFTQEQVKKLTDNACFELNLLTKYDLVPSNGTLIAILTIYDLESGENIDYKAATAKPEIKATNAAQQLGGAMTYTERYLKMTAFGISDNNLDFDTTENTKKRESAKTSVQPKEKSWLNIYTGKDKKAFTKQFLDSWRAVNGYEDKTYSVNDIRKKYKVSKEVEKALKDSNFLTEIDLIP